MVNDAADTTRLCFLDSRRLQAPLVDRLDVWTRTGRRLGTFEGIVVDSLTERARYLVVDGGRLIPDWRLVPLPAQLDFVHQALRVQIEDAESTECTKFNRSRYRNFNPDDETTSAQTPPL